MNLRFQYARTLWTPDFTPFAWVRRRDMRDSWYDWGDMDLGQVHGG